MDIPLARQQETSVQLTATGMSGASSVALQAQPSELMRDIKPRIRDAFRIKDDQDIASCATANLLMTNTAFLTYVG